MRVEREVAARRRAWENAPGEARGPATVAGELMRAACHFRSCDGKTRRSYEPEARKPAH
mgnify:CR=1 FL=1|jgi:hypothetical protein